MSMAHECLALGGTATASGRRALGRQGPRPAERQTFVLQAALGGRPEAGRAGVVCCHHACLAAFWKVLAFRKDNELLANPPLSLSLVCLWARPLTSSAPGLPCEIRMTVLRSLRGSGDKLLRGKVPRMARGPERPRDWHWPLFPSGGHLCSCTQRRLRARGSTGTPSSQLSGFYFIFLVPG